MFVRAHKVYHWPLLRQSWESLRNVFFGSHIRASFSNECEENKVFIAQEVVDHLERVALVDFANKRGVERLQSAIEFADRINNVETADLEPMVSVLKDRCIYLRDDKVNDGSCRESVMANAAVIEEEYFVAPPGNIPVCPRKPILEECGDAY